MISTIEPDGKELARKLNVALAAKGPMHFAAGYLTAERHRAVIRAAQYLLERAEDVLEGR